jgi:sugar-specific transcriptional regulator TrmB
MKRYISILKRLGLKEKEVQIYLDLIENGSSSLTEVVERTALHRPEVYRLMPLLLE